MTGAVKSAATCPRDAWPTALYPVPELVKPEGEPIHDVQIRKAESVELLGDEGDLLPVVA